MKEGDLGEFKIPIVTSSDSFTEEEWLRMKQIADNLEKSLHKKRAVSF
ncbi:hypothetical protein [Aureibacter tunicatorum]|uniref:Septin family protein n=1 Tax=Aureibacter tunicatorum TaxID=866807 RepID=A0AAE3XP10_9BACT|nr:hypothetical protein [Aureibacter tunicatorum]MDR6239483.1 septin family protein [Aureibacter tunicatorum]